MKLRHLEEAALLLIVIGVGAGAGFASFTHVHDFTLTNSPAGTPDEFGWINAAASELVPIGSLISMRRRVRQGNGVGLPLFFLLAATGFSLTAQFAVAQPTIFGWLVSAFPALAFLGLGKLVMSELGSMKPEAPQEPAKAPVIEPEAPQTVKRQPEPEVTRQPEPEAPSEPEADTDDRSENVTMIRPKRAYRRSEGARTRRPMAESIRILREIRDEKPDITDEDLMSALGVNSRQFRNILRAERVAA